MHGKWRDDFRREDARMSDGGAAVVPSDGYSEAPDAEQRTYHLQRQHYQIYLTEIEWSVFVKKPPR